MITISGTSETSLVIKKSRFLGLAVRVADERQAQSEIERRKKQHYDASHNCWAYLLESGAMRYSDDGEPQGTAGLPMLDVIKKSGISNVLVICTRYFGGTLLGTGGLVRAYTQSAAETLGAAVKVRLMPCSVYRCVFSYETWAKAENALKNAGLSCENIEFTDEIIASICVASGSEEAFLVLIQNLSLGKAVPELLCHKLIEVSA